MAITSLVTSAFDTLRGLAGSVGWGPLVQLSRTTILSLLQQVEKGQLVVKEQDGTETVCGRLSVGQISCTELRIRRETFWVRLALFADMVSFKRSRR